MTDFSPREIVSELDRHIVGQTEAKRAVAIALRNRWRRKQLEGSLRDEVMPKNILMIGPTGVGKTEIARRLAKLANAPFLKVEATKFTEVGYVGRDVDQIVRDLVESGIAMVKTARRKEPSEPAKPGRAGLVRESDWDRLMANRDLSRATRYSPRAAFILEQVVDHPSFGLGLVTSVKGPADKSAPTSRSRAAPNRASVLPTMQIAMSCARSGHFGRDLRQPKAIRTTRAWATPSSCASSRG